MRQIVGVDEWMTQRVLIPQFDLSPALRPQYSRYYLNGSEIISSVRPCLHNHPSLPRVIVQTLPNLSSFRAVRQKSPKEVLDVGIIVGRIAVFRINETSHF